MNGTNPLLRGFADSSNNDEYSQTAAQAEQPLANYCVLICLKYGVNAPEKAI